MKVCAALAWFDEPVEFLDRCIRSLGDVVDEVVALDGAWKHQPNADAHSGPDQAYAIRIAALEAGLPVRVIVPPEVFASQVHKRVELMALASEDADWVLVIDGDEYVTYCEFDTLHRELAATELLCGYVAFKNLNRGETMPGTTAHSGLNRRIYKAGTTVKTVHSGYMYEGRNLLVSEDALDLRHCLAIEHDNVNRGPWRNKASRDYRAARAMHGVENWMPVPA